ncbi:hypothetical protein VTN00DRAFT_5341 [Thermoascus crustaceus]|uniref:uncharacterized protein n=1 Tax=Thermoascus crustaceus TaxID=5088 RepID=UPI0037426868
MSWVIEEADGINLRSQLDILMDPKHKTPDDYDARFNEAREGATMTLDLLKDEANTKKEEVERIKDNLIAFKNETLKYHEKVDYLRKQYSTGPVTNGTGHTCIEYLDKELASATGTVIATAWFGLIGWIVMGIKTDEAIKARNAYDKLQDQIAKYNSDEKEIANLIMHVSRLIEQFDDLLPKMETAIKAMAELGSLFTSQADSYDRPSRALALVLRPIHGRTAQLSLPIS